MRVAIIGLGNIGTVYAAHLQAAGIHQVIACVRQPVETLTVGPITVSPLCFTDPAAATPVDWILLATKAHQTAATAPWLHALCGPHTGLCTLQNGIDQLERLPVPVPRSVPSVVMTNSKRLAPGHVRHLNPNHDLILPETPDARELASLFLGSQIVIHHEPDFLTAAWRKLLVNIVANPLTAIAGQGLGILRQPDMHSLALQLLAEAIAVGRAAGANLPDDTAATVLRFLDRPAGVGTSMQEDRAAGRPLEHEALTGAVVKRGRQLGIPTPVNNVILSLLRGLDPPQ